MNEREQLILKAIIKHYLEFGESVGSRTLEKKYSIGVSSATIRNTMADLEDKGLIAKTHTSSGRIPTSEGYKLYVEELIKIRDISTEAKAKVVEAYNKKMNQIDMIFEETSRLLSKISKYAGVVLEPTIRQEGIRKVQLVHINDTNIMAVIIMDSFLTKNLNIFLENPLKEQEVQNINVILNEEIRKSPNFTLSDLEKFLMNTDLFVPEDFQEDKILNEEKCCIFRLRAGRKSIGRGILYDIDTWHRNLSDHGHILDNMIELGCFLLRDLSSPIHSHDHFCRLKNHHSGINRSDNQS